MRAAVLALALCACSLDVKTPLQPCTGGECPSGFACIQDQCVPDQPTGTTCTATVAAGFEHSCAVRTDGAVFCWGRNDFGQIGNGDTTDQLVPVRVVGGAQGGAFLANISRVIAGTQHTCALDLDGGVWCWGKNGEGELGDNTTTDSKQPVKVQNLSGVTQLQAGYSSTCALANEAIQCWGYNNQGELGDNTKTNRMVPTPVMGLDQVTEFAVADESGCAVRKDGSVWCWGENSSGELGDGTTTQRGLAKPIPGISSAQHVGMTWTSGCAQTSYGLECWGNNNEGELGNGGTSDSTIPVFAQVPVILTRLIGGRQHMCGLTFDGELWCWGSDGDGRMFDGGDDYRPGAVKANVPPVTDAAAGGAFTCARLESGAIECVGYNSRGQLGDGKRTTQPLPQAVPGISNATSVMSAGAQTCATLADGTASCWGANGDGQLGDGTYVDRGTPLVVPGLANVTQMDGGYEFSCAVATGGAVYCWGRNDYGALANGNVHHSAVPYAVQGLTGPAKQVSGGRLHACAVLASGSVMCWGYNTDGQIGDNTQTQRLVATPVMTIVDATAVAVGYAHSCAIKGDKTVVCWGDASDGALGNGVTSPDAHTPVAANTVANVTQLVAHGGYTCALEGDGTLFCWGYNGEGELGINTTVSHSTPQMTLTGVAQVSAGGGHACALKTNGELWCWGDAAFGQIGDGQFSQRNAPVKITVTGTPSEVMASNTHTCVRIGGALQCWGSDIWGQLGDGTVDWLVPRGVNIPCE